MKESGVEIKLTVAGTDVEGALNLLDLGGGNQVTVAFIEDTTPGVRLPLFEAGVTLRVREQSDEPDDSTVKLRPCRRSQLNGRWQDEAKDSGWSYKIEQDWAGDRHVLAVSYRDDKPRGLVGAVRAGAEPVGRLFNDRQGQFLVDCASLRVNLDAVTLLPGVTATRWNDVRVDRVDEITVERWVVDDLDFLELSTRVKTVDDAVAKQAALEECVRARGMTFGEQVTKTETVLRHLVGLEPTSYLFPTSR